MDISHRLVLSVCGAQGFSDIQLSRYSLKWPQVQRVFLVLLTARNSDGLNIGYN